MLDIVWTWAVVIIPKGPVSMAIVPKLFGVQMVASAGLSWWIWNPFSQFAIVCTLVLMFFKPWVCRVSPWRVVVGLMMLRLSRPCQRIIFVLRLVVSLSSLLVAMPVHYWFVRLPFLCYMCSWGILAVVRPGIGWAIRLLSLFPLLDHCWLWSFLHCISGDLMEWEEFNIAIVVCFHICILRFSMWWFVTFCLFWSFSRFVRLRHFLVFDSLCSSRSVLENSSKIVFGPIIRISSRISAAILRHFSSRQLFFIFLFFFVLQLYSFLIWSLFVPQASVCWTFCLHCSFGCV